MSNLNNLDSSVVEGQAVYKPFTLAIYDLLVIWFSNSYIWRCPAKTYASCLPKTCRLITWILEWVLGIFYGRS